jgi:hypothetical protein
MKTCTTAKEAAATYREMVAAGRIRQDVREAIEDYCTIVTDLIGAIAPDAYLCSDVPGALMPQWLVPALKPWFDAGPEEKAIAWGQALLDELARLDGKVPDSARSAFALRWTIPAWRVRVRKLWGARLDHVMDTREAAERSGDARAIADAVWLARETYKTLWKPADKQLRFWLLSPAQAFCVDALFYHDETAQSDEEKIAQREWMLDTLKSLP